MLHCDTGSLDCGPKWWTFFPLSGNGSRVCCITSGVNLPSTGVCYWCLHGCDCLNAYFSQRNAFQHWQLINKSFNKYLHTLTVKPGKPTDLLINQNTIMLCRLCAFKHQYCFCRPAAVLSGPDRLPPDANALCSQRWASPDDAEKDEPGKPHPRQWNWVCAAAAEAHRSCCQ